jgi:hypothetical protein
MQTLAERLLLAVSVKADLPLLFSQKNFQKSLLFCCGVFDCLITIITKPIFAPPRPSESKVPSGLI